MSGFEKVAAGLICLTISIAAAALAGITGWWPMANFAILVSAIGSMMIISGLRGLRR